MLDAYIIEDIKRQEEARREAENEGRPRLHIDLEEPRPDRERPDHPNRDGDRDEDRDEGSGGSGAKGRDEPISIEIGAPPWLGVARSALRARRVSLGAR